MRAAAALRGPAGILIHVPSPDIHRTVEAVWRIESARLIAALTRVVRDIGLAEELAQDALLAALEQWPASGVPDNPGAWLMAAVKPQCPISKPPPTIPSMTTICA